MDSPRCPTCGGSKIVAGAMLGVDSTGAAFVPMSSRTTFNPNCVSPSSGFHACLDCGLLWSHIPPDAIRNHLRASKIPLAMQEVDELEFGPFRDLPQTEWGRMIGGHISELDALARAGGTALLRRYRDMRGVTWDVAAREATHWRRLTREQKLELFGWKPKTKPPKDDLAEIL